MAIATEEDLKLPLHKDISMVNSDFATNYPPPHIAPQDFMLLNNSLSPENFRAAQHQLSMTPLFQQNPSFMQQNLTTPMSRPFTRKNAETFRNIFQGSQQKLPQGITDLENIPMQMIKLPPDF